MKVGDLVRIEKWCKNKGRQAIVIDDLPHWEGQKALIRYLDDGATSRVYTQNLEVISGL
tara:strand:- start:1257 stop:1433 length:177 start_codon:yes stop_codon:yes gene_type:complete